MQESLPPESHDTKKKLSWREWIKKIFRGSSATVSKESIFFETQKDMISGIRDFLFNYNFWLEDTIIPTLSVNTYDFTNNLETMVVAGFFSGYGRYIYQDDYLPYQQQSIIQRAVNDFVTETVHVEEVDISKVVQALKRSVAALENARVGQQPTQPEAEGSLTDTMSSEVNFTMSWFIERAKDQGYVLRYGKTAHNIIDGSQTTLPGSIHVTVNHKNSRDPELATNLFDLSREEVLNSKIDLSIAQLYHHVLLKHKDKLSPQDSSELATLVLFHYLRGAKLLATNTNVFSETELLLKLAKTANLLAEPLFIDLNRIHLTLGGENVLLLPKLVLSDIDDDSGGMYRPMHNDIRALPKHRPGKYPVFSNN